MDTEIKCTEAEPCEDCRAEEKRLIAYGKVWEQFFDWLLFPPAREDDDNPAVRLGSSTEPFNRLWLEKKD